jgi:hypothetical protein
LEAEELVDAVSELRTASLSKPELERALERVEALSARVQKALDMPGGLSVAQAAERVEGHKPVEVTQRSVIEVERVLGTVRESYPARRWSEALAAFLHDRDLLEQGWVREGVEQLRQGELIER